MDRRLEAAEFERLLAHAGWLSALARRLVRDPATADDLVQDTWHAALVHHERAGMAQRGERVMSERGWLATLLANLARARARSESARRVRERSVAVSEVIDGPDRLVERAEAQKNLLARVLELDEPYRTTLLARYADGQSSAEIARRTRVNESTVRTRIARAHDQLRERIERHGGGLGALAPILNIATPPPSAVVVGGAKTLGTFAAGVGIMGMALKIGVVAAVGLCGWLAWRGLGPHDDPLAWSPPSTEQISHETLDEPRESPIERVALTGPAPVASTTTAPPSKPAETAPVARKTGLVITVLRDQVPAASVRVWIAPADDWRIFECLDVKARAPQSARTADTDRFGMAVFTELDAKVYNYRVGIGTGADPSFPTRFVTTELFPGHAYEIQLGTASVRGKVFDARGRERAQVGVQIYSAQPDQNHFYFAAHTLANERGEYEIGDLAAGSYIAIMEADGRFDGRGEVERIPFELRTGEARIVDFGSSSPAPRWTGRLLNALGEPFSSGSIFLVSERDARQIVGEVDADGRFDVAFLPGSWKVNARAAGCPSEGFAFGVRELPMHDIDGDLIVQGARLRIHLVEPTVPGTTPAQDTRVDALDVSVRGEGQDYPAAFRSTTWRADGVRVIDGLEPGVWIVSVYPGRFEEGETVKVTIGSAQSVVDVHVRWRAR